MSVKLLISKDDIAQRVDALAAEIVTRIGNRPVVVIGVLTGAVLFVSDLIRRMHEHGADPQIDFIAVSSYENATSSSGSVTILRDIRTDVLDKTVLLIDDIVDTGRTLDELVTLFEGVGAAETLTCALLDKQERRELNVTPDFTGFRIANHFVVGYGLDAVGKYRSLPYIGVLEE